MKTNAINEAVPMLKNDVLNRWQFICDTLAEFMSVTSVIITKLNQGELEVMVSSGSQNNPFGVGDTVPIADSFSEEVVKTKKGLLVVNANNDNNWKYNPGMKNGIVSYLGYPILMANGDVFGTICVMDDKENHHSLLHMELVEGMMNIIQGHIFRSEYLNH